MAEKRTFLNWVDINMSAVPEPFAYALIIGGLGLVGLIASRRNQKRN